MSVVRQGSSHLIEGVAELLRAVPDGAQVHRPARRADQQPPELVGLCTGLGGRACDASRTALSTVTYGCLIPFCGSVAARQLIGGANWWTSDQYVVLTC